MLTLEDLQAQILSLKRMIEETPNFFGKRFTDALVSSNYSSGNSGWKIGENGDVEFNSGVFRGSLTVGANAWHVDVNGNMWWGNYATFAAAQSAGATRIASNGAATFTSLTLTGYIPTGGALSDTQSSIGGGGLSAITANIGTITSGNINGVIITGGTLQTATTGQRIVITQTGNDIKFYSPDGTQQAIMYGDDSLGVVIEPTSSGVLFVRNGGFYVEDTIISESDIIANLNGSGTGSSGGFMMDGIAVIDYNRVARNLTGLFASSSSVDIGSGGSRWGTLFATVINASSTINCGGYQIFGTPGIDTSFYVATSSGGSPTRRITVSKGIIVS